MKLTKQELIELIEKLDIDSPQRKQLEGFYKYLTITKETVTSESITGEYDYIQAKMRESDKTTGYNMKCSICKGSTDVLYSSVCEKCFAEWVLTILNAARKRGKSGS